jgi:hypothetical protein
MVHLPAKHILYMDVVILSDEEDFEPLWNGATLASINGTPVRVVSRDTLRRMNEWAAREGDDRNKLFAISRI